MKSTKNSKPQSKIISSSEYYKNHPFFSKNQIKNTTGGHKTLFASNNSINSSQSNVSKKTVDYKSNT